MKKIHVIVFAVLATLSLSSCKYNSMVSSQETVESQWGNVQNAYQRRADLIPNLVATVKGEAAFEQQTLTAVAEARSKATQMTVSADDLSPEKIREYQATQGQLSMALGRFLSIAEAYPTLQANQSFKDLQAQLEGTENRINVERNKFNEVARDYNTMIKQFPQVIYASWFGFKEKGYFEADKGSEKAPKVSF